MASRVDGLARSSVRVIATAPAGLPPDCIVNRNSRFGEHLRSGGAFIGTVTTGVGRTAVRAASRHDELVRRIEALEQSDLEKTGKLDDVTGKLDDVTGKLNLLFEKLGVHLVVREVLERVSARVQSKVFSEAPPEAKAAAIAAARNMFGGTLNDRLDILENGGKTELPWTAFGPAWDAAWPQWTSVVGNDRVVEFVRQRGGRHSLQENCSNSAHRTSLADLRKYAKEFSDQISRFVADKALPPPPTVGLVEVIDWLEAASAVDEEVEASRRRDRDASRAAAAARRDAKAARAAARTRSG